jgi:hypothetical protein
VDFSFDDRAIGEITRLDLSHDSRGIASGWNLSYVEVDDLKAGRRAVFVHSDVLKHSSVLSLERLTPQRNVYKVEVVTSDVAGAGERDREGMRCLLN